jgi:hypothetical protein
VWIIYITILLSGVSVRNELSSSDGRCICQLDHLVGCGVRFADVVDHDIGVVDEKLMLFGGSEFGSPSVVLIYST